MTTKHTPGPWHVEGRSGDFQVVAPVCSWAKGEPGMLAAVLYLGNEISSIFQEEANARLIAAAPEMRDYLAALIGAIDRKGYEDPTLTAMANEVAALLARIDGD